MNGNQHFYKILRLYNLDILEKWRQIILGTNERECPM